MKKSKSWHKEANKAVRLLGLAGLWKHLYGDKYEHTTDMGDYKVVKVFKLVSKRYV